MQIGCIYPHITINNKNIALRRLDNVLVMQIAKVNIGVSIRPIAQIDNPKSN